MSGTRWYQDRRRDGYFRKAKKEGYRARSAYKLKQINDRFRVIKKGMAAADLGCAPGGWSQVLVEMVESHPAGPDAGLVIGVDLQRTRPMDGAKFIQGDFTVQATHERLTKLLHEAGKDRLDVVVSDMAPDMSGNYDLDQARSVHLCTMGLDFARAHLKIGGAYIMKIFEGADFQEFREELRKHFGVVRQYHPEASRKASSEVYLIAMKMHPHASTWVEPVRNVADEEE